MAKRWYVVHVYSGFEHQVVRSLRERIKYNAMEEAFGDVKRLGRGKLREPRLADLPDDAPEPTLETPGLPTEGDGLRYVDIQPRHRELLDRHDRCPEPTPELNLRGMRRVEAVRELALFVDLNAKDGRRFLRIITGRGKRSEHGEPVIKPAVIEWLDGPGTAYVRGYAPEVNRAGDYGSLVVELASDDG